MLMVWGGIQYSDVKEMWDCSTYIACLPLCFGRFGNAVFMLITGYFSISRKQNSKKIINLIGTELFYSWLILALFTAMGYGLNTGTVIKVGFPLFSGNNWYVSCYIYFSLLIPFINRFLASLDVGEYKKFLILIYLLGLALPYAKFQTFFEAGNDIIFFFIMYSTGAYFRLCEEETDALSARRLDAIIAGLVLIIVGCTYILGRYIGKPQHTGLFSALLAVAVFARCLRTEPFYSKSINTVAKTCIGIYLIHDNQLVRHLIWDGILPNINYLHTGSFLIILVVKVICVFVICSCIEWLRSRMARKLSEVFVKRPA